MARGAVPVEVLRLPGFSLDDLPPDAPEHEAALAGESRLGRSLAAIIPGEPRPLRRRGGVASVIPLGPEPAPAGPVAVASGPARPSAEAAALLQRLHGDLVVALLDGLVAAVSCDLAAYLHQPDRGAPSLHLGRPGMADLAAGDAFALFRALDRQMGTRPGVVEQVSAGGFDAIAVVVAGTGARGLWVCGRRGRPPGDVEQAVAYLRGTGSAATLIDADRSGPPPTPPLVSARVGEGEVVAEVDLTGGRTATAGAPTGVEAAARATFDAAGTPAEFLYAAAAREGANAAAVVLARHGGRVRVGACAGPGEAPVLTAAAALRAAGEPEAAGPAQG